MLLFIFLLLGSFYLFIYFQIIDIVLLIFNYYSNIILECYCLLFSLFFKRKIESSYFHNFGANLDQKINLFDKNSLMFTCEIVAETSEFQVTEQIIKYPTYQINTCVIQHYNIRVFLKRKFCYFIFEILIFIIIIINKCLIIVTNDKKKVCIENIAHNFSNDLYLLKFIQFQHFHNTHA